MKFKNGLEQRCFEIARRVLGSSVEVEHNKSVQIESALFPEVAAFKGPPKKEVDVLIAELLSEPRVMLLVSCKELSRRAEPAHVQEWAAVVRTMNNYSKGTLYLGLVISPTGFSSGCESWATSHNVGLIPPLKGRQLAFSPETVFRMFERSLVGLRSRVRLHVTDLATAPAFFDFVYSLVSDFEGHEEVAREGRYFLFPQGWVSSFGEMYSCLAGHMVENLVAAEDGGTTIILAEGVGFRFTGSRIEFGQGIELKPKPLVNPVCVKNVDGEPCTLDFIKSIVIGTRVMSAADFGDYVEFGLDERFNLRLSVGGFHVFSTENPVDEHRL
jgi:hypothetical protein